MERNNLPSGFGMALAQNAPALRAFAAMSESEQNAVLEQIRQVRSKDKMRKMVEKLAQQD